MAREQQTNDEATRTKAGKNYQHQIRGTQVKTIRGAADNDTQVTHMRKEV